MNPQPPPTHPAPAQDALFPEDEIIAYELPYGFMQLQMATESKVPSPWITSHRHILRKYPLTSHELPLRNHSPPKYPKFRIQKDLVPRRPIESSQETYKMNSTLVEFRVKHNVKEGIRGKNNSRVLERLEASPSSRCGNRLSQFSEDKSKRRLHSIGDDPVEKTPKMKFLQRKLRIKEFSGLALRRRQNEPSDSTVEPTLSATLNKRTNSISERRRCKPNNTITLRGCNRLTQPHLPSERQSTSFFEDL